MTVQPTDRDWGRLDALVDEDPIALRDAAWRLTTALAAAECRIARLEAQTDIRGRAVVMYRDRARQAEADRDWLFRSSRLSKKERIKANARAEKAEARIKAVEDVLAAWHVEPGESGLADDLLRALNT